MFSFGSYLAPHFSNPLFPPRLRPLSIRENILLPLLLSFPLFVFLALLAYEIVQSLICYSKNILTSFGFVSYCSNPAAVNERQTEQLKHNQAPKGVVSLIV